MSEEGRERIARVTNALMKLHARASISTPYKTALAEAANMIAWDDALHIAAPWNTQVALCGLWHRNLVAMDAPHPDGMEGCWSCLMVADWLRDNLK